MRIYVCVCAYCNIHYFHSLLSLHYSSLICDCAKRTRAAPPAYFEPIDALSTRWRQAFEPLMRLLLILKRLCCTL